VVYDRDGALGLYRIDIGGFTHPDRRVTRQVAEELHVLLAGKFAGIRYPSVLDPAAECRAIGDPRKANCYTQSMSSRSTSPHQTSLALPALGLAPPH
jgi:hypothetical protein